MFFYLNITLSDPSQLKKLWINVTFSELGGVAPDNVRIYFYNETSEQWEELENTGVDLANEIVWGWTDHVTVFGVMDKETEETTEEGGSELPIAFLFAIFLVVGGIAGTYGLYMYVKKKQEGEE